MVQPESNVEFYQQDAIQKIIDYQFVTTKKFFINLMTIYIIGFVIPILLIIFYDDIDVSMVCYIVGYFTQMFFFIYEMIQAKATGWKYFKGWNLSDQIQFLIFLTLMFMQFLYPNNNEESIFQMLLMCILIMQVFMKILFFMKVFADYGFLVQMIGLSILDLGPFLAFFALWVLFFTIEFKILGWEYEEEDYEGLTSF